MSAQSRITPANSTFAQLSDLLKQKLSSRGIETDDRLILACSGGCDSMVLLHLLCENGNSVEVAHVNYHLRGEDSNRDEALVRETAQKLGIPFHLKEATESIFPKGKNLQEAARTLRYRFFNELAEQRNAKAILTAHHQRDQAETVLLNLLRGSGLSGLSGMPEENGLVFRPLLEVPQEQIRQAAIEKNIPWRDDASNAETKYRRNFIRLELLTQFEKHDPKIVQKLAETAARLKSTALVLDELIKKESLAQKPLENAVFSIPISRMAESSEPATLLYLFVKAFGFSHSQCAEATQNLTPSRGKHWTTPEFTLWRKKGYFAVYQNIE